MPGPSRGASRSRIIEVAEREISRDLRPSKGITSFHPSGPAESGLARKAWELRAQQSRFGEAGGAFRLSRLWTGVFKGAIEAFREAYRRWSLGPPGFLLMGASFLLTDGSLSFQAENSLDRTYPIKEGRFFNLDESMLPFRWPHWTKGDLPAVSMRVGPAGVDFFNPRGAEIWIRKEGELRRLEEWDEALLQHGDIFILGEKPLFMDRNGFARDRSTVFRVEHTLDGWSVRELAHAEEKIEDYHIERVARGLGIANKLAREMLEPFHRELDRSGWTQEQKVAFLAKDFMDPEYFEMLARMGFNVIPVYQSMEDMLRLLREDSWSPADTYRIMKAIVDEGPGFEPAGFTERIAVQSIGALREMGFETGEIAQWTAKIMRGRSDFDDFFSDFPAALKALIDLGVEQAAAAPLLIETFQLLRGQEYSPEALAAVHTLVRFSQFEAGQILSLIRTLVEFFNYAAKRDEGLAKALAEPDAPQFSADLWEDPNIAVLFLETAARFGAFLRQFEIPSPTRLRLIEEMIKTYEDGAVSSMRNLMQATYWDYFSDWRVTLNELFEELKSDREDRGN